MGLKGKHPPGLESKSQDDCKPQFSHCPGESSLYLPCLDATKWESQRGWEQKQGPEHCFLSGRNISYFAFKEATEPLSLTQPQPNDPIFTPPGHLLISTACKDSFPASNWSFPNSYLLSIHIHQQKALGPCSKLHSWLCFHSWWRKVLDSSRQILSIISFPFLRQNDVHQLPLQADSPICSYFAFPIFHMYPPISHLEFFITHWKCI